MAQTLHNNEIAIQHELVRELVDTQFSVYASLPLVRLPASGSTNVIYRLGHDLLVRLPRQPGGGAAIGKEQLWLPHISPNLGVAAPEIVHVGEPGHGYPERWAIVRWLEGDTVDPSMAQMGGLTLARDLAAVINQLRAQPVPPHALKDPALRWYRGRPLAEFDHWTRESMATCRRLADLDVDLDLAEALWSKSLQIPGAHTVASTTWYHSDLVAENLLLVEGRLSAVLDFGGLGIGDPVVDLHGAWELFGAEARGVFRDQLQASEDEWALGRAWALAIALSTFAYYWSTMPRRCRDRLVMLRAVLDV